MKTMFPPGVLMLIVCLVAGPLAGQDEGAKAETAQADAIKVDLKPGDIGDSSNPLAELAGRYVYGKAEVTTLRAKPSQIGSQAAYFQTRIGETDLLMGLDYGRSGSKLYIDTNSNGSLADERPMVAGMARSRNQIFPPLPIRGPGGAKMIIKIEVVSQGTLLVYPGAMLRGTAKVDGKSYSVFVVDGNLSGTYNDQYSGGATSSITGPPFDVFGCDMNGNRRLEVDKPGCVEAMPMPKVVRIGGGFYSVTVAAEGQTAELSKVEQATGTLEIGTPYAELLLWSENGSYRIAGGVAKCELPAGKYYPKDLRLLKREGSTVWTLDGYVGGKVVPFDIAAGETKSLNMGTPLVVKVDFMPGENGTQSMGFSVYGSADEPYSPTVCRNGQKQPLPKFKIIDEAGQTVGSGSWSYG